MSRSLLPSVNSIGAPPQPIVFAYDFPHKKTQDVLLMLVAAGIRPQAVLAAPPVVLSTPPASIRVKPRHAALIEPATLCRALGIDYHVVDHRSDDCLVKLDQLEPSVGVISGARMLTRHVIERFSRGIINFHPGLLPNVRGLDALQWAIYRDEPLGVTAHLIDQRVDAGHVLDRCLIDEYPDDTLIDLSIRLYETQLTMLVPAIVKALATPTEKLHAVSEGTHNRSFPAQLVPQLRSRFRARRRRLRVGQPGALRSLVSLFDARLPSPGLSQGGPLR